MSAKHTKIYLESQQSLSNPYNIPEIYLTQEYLYQDKDGTWMVQPVHKEGWIIEPHAMYNPPTDSEPLNR